MFSFPLDRVIDLHFMYHLPEIMEHRNSEPLPTFSCFDFIAVLPLIFFKLDIIQKYECIASVDLLKVSQPWQVLRLVNGYNQIFIVLAMMSSYHHQWLFQCKG